MPHVVLLGDSIFDNAAYVSGGPDVVRQLRGVLPGGWEATLRAVDGAVTADVERQLQRLPPDATHLVLSVGGNDALRHTGIVERGARSVAEVLDLLDAIGADFAGRYHALLERLDATGLPLTLCTIYEGSFPDPVLHRRLRFALHAFNDTILRASFARRRTLLDLRLICSDPADYANPIEPSVRGGEKIARAIARAVALPDAEEAARVVV